MTRPDSPYGREPTSWHYLAALGRNWAVILLSCLVAGAAALAISTYALPKSYESTATVLVNPAPPADGSSSRTLFVGDQSVGKTFEELALQPAVASAAARRLGVLDHVPLRRVDVHAVPKTPLLEFTYRSSTPEAAQRGARAYTEVFVTTVGRGQWLKAKASLVSPASLPRAPATPRPVLNTVIAALAGLLSSMGVVCLVEQSRRFRRSQSSDSISAQEVDDAVDGWPARQHAAAARAGTEEVRVLPTAHRRER